MSDHPLYVMRDPEEYAADFKERLVKIGCSEEYAEEARKTTIERAVQVASPFEANAIAAGRAKRP